MANGEILTLGRLTNGVTSSLSESVSNGQTFGVIGLVCGWSRQEMGVLRCVVINVMSVFCGEQPLLRR